MEIFCKLFGLKRGFLGDWRIWVLLLPALFILASDMPVLMTLLYSVSAMLVVAVVGHVMRRILFSYLDMKELADRALDSPAGAGQAFTGICLFLGMSMIATAIWIGH